MCRKEVPYSAPNIFQPKASVSNGSGEGGEVGLRRLQQFFIAQPHEVLQRICQLARRKQASGCGRGSEEEIQEELKRGTL